jgi:hypothetical protein
MVSHTPLVLPPPSVGDICIFTDVLFDIISSNKMYISQVRVPCMIPTIVNLLGGLMIGSEIKEKHKSSDHIGS